MGAAQPEGDNNFGGFMGGMQASVTSPGDFNHRLLSLDGPTLYFQTNLGALVAIEAATGSTLWVATYPRQEPSPFGGGGERDLNPAVVHDGRVFIAPATPTPFSRSMLAAGGCSGRRNGLPTTSSFRICWGLPRDG